MSTTVFTNAGRNAIAEALSTDKRLTIARVAFGDKGVTPNSIHTPNSQGLMNERFRMNVDNVYYPTVSEGSNAVVRVTATLTPEQASNMDPITVREFGLIDSTDNFIILGTTVTTLTKEDGNGNGISFDLNIALPSPDKIVNIVLNPNDGDFNEAYRLKLIGIEERATKNESDSFLTNRANHTGKQSISTIVNLEEELTSLNNNINSKTSKFKGMFLNHADFLNSLRVFADGEEPEAGNITNSKIEDNYFNNETKSVWYYKGENVWLDSNEHLIDNITSNTNSLTAVNGYVNEISIKINNSTSLGIFETVVDLPASPNFDTESNSFSPIIYNAFVKDTKSTWWHIPEKDINGIVIGGNWVESTGDLDNKLENKVDKITGKTLTTNDFTNTLKDKLDNIEVNAQVNPIIVNNLTSTDTDKTLAANQGFILKGYIDNLNTAINNINEILTSNDTTLDELQEIVNYIKTNKTVLETLAITNIAGLETALNTLTNNKLDKSGGVTSGPIIGLKEKVVTMTNGIIDLDAGNIFIKNVTGDTSFTLNNVNQESGVAQSFTLELTNAGNYIITWWNNLAWDEGNPPTLPQNTTSIFGFYTTNNGNTWRGFVASKDMR